MVAPRKTNPAEPLPAPSGVTEFLIKLPNLAVSPAAENPHAAHMQPPADAGSTPAYGEAPPELHPAFVELAEVRSRRQASAVPPSFGPTTHHHVDRAHLRVVGGHTSLPDGEDECLHTDLRAGAGHARLDTPRSMSGDLEPRSRGGLAWLGVVNEAVAPFAGLIVTLALLTGAGLLFWLISDHRQDEFHLEQIGIGGDGFSVDALEIGTAEKLPPGPAPIAGDATSPRPSSGEANDSKVSMAGEPEKNASPASEETSPVTSTPPVATEPGTANPLAQDEPQSLGFLGYPRTRTPDALAFDRVINPAADGRDAQPVALPEIADRGNSAEKPVAR